MLNAPTVTYIFRGYLLGGGSAVATPTGISAVTYQVRVSNDDTNYGSWNDLATVGPFTSYQFIHDSLSPYLYYEYRMRLDYDSGKQSDWSDFVVAGAGGLISQPSDLDQLAASLGTISGGYMRGVVFETSPNYPKVRMDPQGFFAISTTSTPVKIPSDGSRVVFEGHLEASGLEIYGLNLPTLANFTPPNYRPNYAVHPPISDITSANSQEVLRWLIPATPTYDINYYTTPVASLQGSGSATPTNSTRSFYSNLRLSAWDTDIPNNEGSFINLWSAPSKNSDGSSIIEIAAQPSTPIATGYGSVEVYAGTQHKTLLDSTGFSDFLSPPSCQLRNSASQSISTGGGYTKLTLDTVVWDNDGLADLANSQVKIVHAGKYRLTAWVAYTAGSGNVGCGFFINGANGPIAFSPNMGSQSHFTSITMNLAVGTTIDLRTHHDAGVSENIQVDTTIPTPGLTVEFVGLP